jgi:hypothetical protein
MVMLKSDTNGADAGSEGTSKFVDQSLPTLRSGERGKWRRRCFRVRTMPAGEHPPAAVSTERSEHVESMDMRP